MWLVSIMAISKNRSHYLLTFTLFSDPHTSSVMLLFPFWSLKASVSFYALHGVVTILQVFFNFYRSKEVIQDWNNLRLSKRCQEIFFFVFFLRNYSINKAVWQSRVQWFTGILGEVRQVHQNGILSVMLPWWWSRCVLFRLMYEERCPPASQSVLVFLSHRRYDRFWNIAITGPDPIGLLYDAIWRLFIRNFCLFEKVHVCDHTFANSLKLDCALYSKPQFTTNQTALYNTFYHVTYIVYFTVCVMIKNCVYVCARGILNYISGCLELIHFGQKIAAPSFLLNSTKHKLVSPSA